MKTHHFTLILADLAEMTDEAANALYEAGCDDGSPGSCNGVSSIDVHREAATLEDAIRSASEDVARAGYRVARVEIAHDFLKELLRAPAPAKA